MDAEELRRSQRRLSKKPASRGRAADESEDLSDEEEQDDASAPNADSAGERGRAKQMAMHSVRYYWSNQSLFTSLRNSQMRQTRLTHYFATNDFCFSADVAVTSFLRFLR